MSKAFRLYPHKFGRLREWLGGECQHSLTWILREINLNVGSGESVGLVGRNGAGKSTLLKLITGVSAPTSGSIRVGGRISALLELGMGFHPEFTGRQNAFMQAYLQGLGHDEIRQLMPSIEAFAEIGDYFDRPIRIYSSGMQVRLAFAVATAAKPDILIVDEALAVGDAYFQHKCFDRIRRFRSEGTTLLFVSHDPGAVKSLCNRAVLIDGGRIVMDGSPDNVLDYYNALIAPEAASTAITEAGGEAGGTRSGNGKLRIRQVELVAEGNSVRAVSAGQEVAFRLLIEARDSLDNFTVGILLKDRLGNDVFGTNTHHMMLAMPPIQTGSWRQIEFRIPALNIGPGHYSVTLAAHASSEHVAGSYDWWDRCLVFQVVPAQGTHTIGVAHMAVSCIWDACEPHEPGGAA